MTQEPQRPPSPESVDAALDQVRQIGRENSRLFRRLMSQEKRLRALAKAAWRVQEEERRRFARELHDGLGQLLTALKNQLEWLQRREEAKPAPEHLAECVDMASQALQTTRELSRLLRPSVLDNLGLEPALRWLCRSFGSRGLTVDLTADLDGRIAAELETVVFRVVQEALNNVEKHSGSESAEVRVANEDGWLRVEVIDHGAGFDPDAVLKDGYSSGLGLSCMRDRAELFGGRLAVDSAAGAGTHLWLDLPYIEGEKK